MKKPIKTASFDGDIVSDDTSELFYEEEYDSEQLYPYSEFPGLAEISESEGETVSLLDELLDELDELLDEGSEEEFEGAPELFEEEFDDEWSGEISRRSPGYIRWVQGSLNRIMGFNLKIDGIIGPQTRNAIRRFQKKKGLKVDGIVGPRTEAALKAALSGKRIDQGAQEERHILDHFDFDDARLKPAHHNKLIEIARIMIDSQRTSAPIRSVRIIGHTDPVGTDDYNLRLGKRRADQVAHHLRATLERMKPGSSRTVILSTETRGEQQPKSTPTESRRVEVILPLQDYCGSKATRRIRLSLFDFNPSFASSFRFSGGNPIGYVMDTALLDAFAAARIDDYSLVRTITFDGGSRPPKWSGFSPRGDVREAMRIDYLQRLTTEMHSRGAQVFVGYEMVEPGTTVSRAGAAFRSWLGSATVTQLGAHAQAIVEFFTRRGIAIDGIGFDIELNGLSPAHSPKLAVLFAETARAMAAAQPGGKVYYDTAPFQPNDGAGAVATMAPLRYALALGAPNLIARPMCYNKSTVTPQSTIVASIDCALRPTSRGGGGLTGSQLQPAIDVSRTSDIRVITMCTSLFRPRGVGMTIYTMPGGRAAQQRLLARARSFEAALNPGIPAPSLRCVP